MCIFWVEYRASFVNAFEILIFLSVLVHIEKLLRLMSISELRQANPNTPKPET